MDEFKKGSIWRKWDLHVHTPISYYNEFSSWESYIKCFKEKAKENEIEVVVINDYFTIEGYKYLLEKYCQTYNDMNFIELENEKKVYILPGVELRIDNFTSDETSINIHLIFNEKLKIELIEDFIDNLTIHYDGKELNCNTRSLIKIGFSKCKDKPYDENLDLSNINETDKQKYIKEALSVITIDFNALKKSIDEFNNKMKGSEFYNNCILVVAAFKGHGSLDQIEWKDGRSNNVKKNILRKADLCFSSNEKDISFLLGKNETVSKEDIILHFGSLKPCVWGSDSHHEEKLLCPSNGETKKFTWIKALPSFKGLKQVLYEPEYRVKIQENLPCTKADYQTIDRIRFIDNKSNDFSSEWIELNKDLNTIIGGKSSGKSLLLNKIAHTINPKLYEDKYKNFQELDFEVVWNDGTIYKLFDPSSLDNRKKITYISQLYLNKLAENPENELQQIILGIILQNEDFYKKYNLHREEIKNLNSDIDNLLSKIKNNIQSLDMLEQDHNDIGQKNGIKKEITKLQEEKNELLKKSKLLDEEFEFYTRISNEIQEDRSKLVYLNNTVVPKILDTKNKFINLVNDFANEYFILKENCENFLEEEFYVIEDVFWYIKQKIQDISNIIEKFDAKVKEVNFTISKLKSSILEKEKSIEVHKLKLRNKERIDRINKEIEKLKNKLNKINDIEKRKSTIITEISNFLDKLAQDYEKRYESYLKLEKSFIDNNNIDDEGLEIDVRLLLDVELLISKFEDIINKKYVKNFEIDWDKIKSNSFIYIRDLFNDIIFDNKKIVLKQNYNYLDLLKIFTEDYYRLVYFVKQSGDDIKNMSPGKQALVLLKLFIKLSNADHPILIDQPEDNLDNRTISTELNEYLKKKKLKRQIIMITHNANLAVLTDSDQIIVANQSGQQTNRDNRRYRFEYVTGPLEYSFTDESKSGILYKKGIREHVCDILEGGEAAFKLRENKYGIQ